MSNGGGENGAPNLSGWEPLIEAAIDLASNYPEAYRVPIVEAILRGETDRFPQAVANETGADISPADEGIAAREAKGLAGAAEAADVSVVGLSRIVRVTDEGELELLARVKGRSTAEKCRKAAVVYAFLQEKAFNRLDIDIEELREVADRQGAYDSPNFTRHLRAEDLLLEMGERGTSKKEYRLSPKGEQAAKEFIRELVGE